VISDPNVVIEGRETTAPSLVAELKAMGGRVEVVAGTGYKGVLIWSHGVA